jgi:hypothetical protein
LPFASTSGAVHKFKYLYLPSNQQNSTQIATSHPFTCSLIGMSTESQQEASRANGSKSRGAVTPEGKLASSRNALKHGMLSSVIVLQCESKDRFDKLVASLFGEFQPQTSFEESLIENMAIVRWRQARILAMEKAGMDYEMRRQAEKTNSSEDAATRASIAFRTLSDDSRSLELINRYESRYERQYYRAHPHSANPRATDVIPASQGMRTRSPPEVIRATQAQRFTKCQPPQTRRSRPKLLRPKKV